MGLLELHRRRSFFDASPVEPGVYNTYIGGYGTSITTAQLLADKLKTYPANTAFPVANIENFTINGNDISCYITADYQIILDYAFAYSCTHFRDLNGYLKKLAGIAIFELAPITRLKLSGLVNISGFKPFNQSQIKELIFNNLTSCGANAFSDNTVIKNRKVYIPNCTNLGGTNLDNSVFVNTSQSSKIYANTFLSTNNSGSPDGDLQYAVTNGAIVRYINNYTAPVSITDLSIGAINGTSMQLNFTAPTGSVNSIEFYEVYIDGIYNNTILASGEYATGLKENTAYSIVVKPVDIYYNKSSSNTIQQSTSFSSVHTSGLMSYYKLDGNGLDSYSTNNAAVFGTTPTVSGKVGTALNLTNGYLEPFLSSSLLPTKSTPFSVLIWSKPDVIGSGNYANRLFTIYKAAGSSAMIFGFDNTNKIFLFLEGTRYEIGAAEVSIFYHFAVRYNGSEIKVSINNKLLFTLSYVFTVAGSANAVQISHSAAVKINGLADEAAIYNISISDNTIADSFNNGNGVTI